MTFRSLISRFPLGLCMALALSAAACDSSSSPDRGDRAPADQADRPAASDASATERFEADERARLLAERDAQAQRSGERVTAQTAEVAVTGKPLDVPGEAATIGGSGEYTAKQIELGLYGFQLLADEEPNQYGPPHAAVARTKSQAAPAGKAQDGNAPDGPSAAAVTASPTFSFSIGSATDPINIGGHPSDASVSVGRSHVCVTARAALACYTKGGRIIMAPTTATTFFASLGFTGLFDLRTGYDHFRDRFWIIGLTGYGSSPEDKVAIAVSRSGDPRDGWYLYWTNAYGAVAPSGNNADYPLIGFDSTAVYITNLVDYPSGSGTSRYAHIVLFRASDMAAGKPMSQVQGWRFWNLGDPDGNIVRDLMTPVNNHTALARGFFLNRRSSNLMDVYALNNPLSGSQTWTVRAVSLAAFGSPNTGPQLLDSWAGTAKPVKFDNLGTGALNAHYRDGHLVFATNDERNWDSQGDRPSVRLVKLNVTNLDAIQVEIDRTFGARSAGESAYFAYGWAAVGINASAEVALGYVRTGDTIFPQLRVSSWLPGDLDLRSSALATNGFATFQPPSGLTQVWYDTANASIDPVDDDGIYFAQQYPTTIFGNVTNNFRMLVFKMFGQTRPDVVPLSVSKSASTVTRGSSFSVTLSIANDGDATMPAFTGEVRLSTNTYFSTGDVLCNAYAQAALSYASAPRTVVVSCTAPTTMSAGTYYVGTLLDTGNAAAETDESNNANPSFVTFPTIQVL